MTAAPVLRRGPGRCSKPGAGIPLPPEDPGPVQREPLDADGDPGPVLRLGDDLEAAPVDDDGVLGPGRADGRAPAERLAGPEDGRAVGRQPALVRGVADEGPL